MRHMQESMQTSVMSQKKQNLKVNQHANFTTVHIQQMSYAMQHCHYFPSTFRPSSPLRCRLLEWRQEEKLDHWWTDVLVVLSVTFQRCSASAWWQPEHCWLFPPERCEVTPLETCKSPQASVLTAVLFWGGARRSGAPPPFFAQIWIF